MSFHTSQKLYNKGLKNLVGAVNSPVRAFASVGGNPLFIKKAKGSRIIDVDGNNYVSSVMNLAERENAQVISLAAGIESEIQELESYDERKIFWRYG